MADEEEVVCTLWYPCEVGVTDFHDAEMKDVTEDFWRYPCDIQQRVSGPFESDNFCIDGVREANLTAHPDGDLNAAREVSHTV